MLCNFNGLFSGRKMLITCLYIKFSILKPTLKLLSKFVFVNQRYKFNHSKLPKTGFKPIYFIQYKN